MQLAQVNLPIPNQKQKLRARENMLSWGLVLLLLPNQKCKLQAKWQSLCRIMKKIGPVHYDLPYIFTVLQNNYCKNNHIPCFISTDEIGNAGS